MKKLISFIVFLLTLNLASANIVITEVMYNPASDQGADASAEWIEIYNNGNLENLSSYTLDGKQLIGSINSDEYLIIAKNIQGFESYYGNNDSIWNNLDGSYNVIESSFSLVNTEDTIDLSNEDFSEILTYSSIWGANGNGFTLQKIDVDKGNDRENWNESSVYGGTPGQSFEQSNDNQIKIKLEVGSSMQITDISLTDDSSSPGIQILPIPKKTKSFQLKANINSSQEIESVKATFNGKEYLMQNKGQYEANLSLNYYDKAGNYTIIITAKSINGESTTKEITLEYLGILSSSLSVNELNFGIVEKDSYSNELQVSVMNEGNIDLDLEVTGSDLKNGNNIIPSSNIEVLDEDWIELSKQPKLIDTLISPGLNSKKDLKFRVKVPQINQGNYEGKIEIIGLEK